MGVLYDTKSLAGHGLWWINGLAEMIRYSFAAILAFLSLTLTACAGGGEEIAEPAITAPPASPATTPRASTPTITDNLFEFQDKGYSVRFPEGWTPLPDFLPGPPLSVDAFFGPEEVKGIQPNIAVTCEQLTKRLTLKEYFDAKVDVVKQVTKAEPEITSGEVSGREALVLRFARQEKQPPLEKTEVVFVTETCGWSIALTVPYSERTSYYGLFEQFLESFRLLP
jgi:hypothetical protein